MLLARDEAFARTLSAAGLLQNALEEGEVESSQGVKFDGDAECLEDIEAEFAELFPDPDPTPDPTPDLEEDEEPEFSLEWAQSQTAWGKEFSELTPDQLTQVLDSAKEPERLQAASMMLAALEAEATIDPEPEPVDVPVAAPSVKANQMDKFIATVKAEADGAELSF